jgi:hypothetical protein
MSRIARGWLLTKESWAVVRRDRSLLMFPVIAGYGTLCVAAAFVGIGLIVRTHTHSVAPLIAVGVIAIYLIAVISTFCNVALSACAARALDGRNTTTGEGLRLAMTRVGAIVGWATIQMVVGALNAAIQAALRQEGGALIARIVGGLTSLAWSAASFFVLPVIALEGVGPGEALSRSTEIVRARWGEGVVGSAAIGGLLGLFVFLPGVGLIAAGLGVHQTRATAGVALIAVGGGIMLVGIVVQTALIATFRVALYRFATEGRVVGGFQREPMESAFAPRSRRRLAGI